MAAGCGAWPGACNGWHAPVTRRSSSSGIASAVERRRLIVPMLVCFTDTPSGGRLRRWMQSAERYGAWGGILSGFIRNVA